MMDPKIYCKKVGENWVICSSHNEGAVAFNLERPLVIPALLEVMAFLCWYEQEDATAIWGGINITDAIKSLQLVVHMPDHVFSDLEKVVLGTFAGDH